MKKILIIIPVYNAAKYISNTLNSLKRQTYKNISIAVINDGSTDCSNDELFKRVYGELNISGFDWGYFFNEKNIGTYQSINMALDKHKNKEWDYYFFHGADDVSSIDRFENLVKEFKPGLMGVSDRYHIIEHDTYVPRTKEANFGHSMIMYSREVFERLGYYDNTRFAGDSEFWNRFIACYGKEKVCFLHHIGSSSLWHADSLTNTIKLGESERINYVEKFTKEHEAMKASNNFYRGFII